MQYNDMDTTHARGVRVACTHGRSPAAGQDCDAEGGLRRMRRQRAGAKRALLRLGAACVFVVAAGGCTDRADRIMSSVSPSPSGARAGGIVHGVFLGDEGSQSHRIGGAIDAFGALAGSRPTIIKTFHRLDDDFGAGGWAGRTVREVLAAGATPLLALDLRWGAEPAARLLEAIAAGAADPAIRALARDLAPLGGPILLEPGWEMNGDWDYPWQAAANGGAAGPAAFAAAWRRIVGIAREEGASNLRWVFSPNVGNPVAGAGAGPDHWNWYGHFFPGRTWVDYLGLHGFNAPSLWRTPFLTFQQLFDSPASDRMLSDMTARYPGLPIIIAEFASEEGAPGAKAAWIRDAYDVMHAHPAIVAAVWFHMDKETDWRVNSSTTSLQAFRNATATPSSLP
jgi:hypothetical protein